MRIEEAAKSVGLSTRQLRRRLEATAPLLAPYVRRGEKNAVLLDAGAVEILRAIEGRRATGTTLEDAVTWVADGMRRKDESEHGRGDRETPAATSGELAVLRELVEELRRDRDHWRDMAVKLQDQLALPSPSREEPRRPWILRLLHPITAARG